MASWHMKHLKLSPASATAGGRAYNVVESWETLAFAIGKIYEENASSLRFEELHHKAYKIVLGKQGQFLYDNVQREVSKHCAALAADLPDRPNDTLVTALLEKWNKHKWAMGRISDILMYMDRNYSSKHKRPHSYDMGIRCFYEASLKALASRIQGVLVAAVQAARTGAGASEIELLSSALRMLTEIGSVGVPVYEQLFEAPFLTATGEYYAACAAEHMASQSPAEYCAYALDCIDTETQRGLAYLPPPTMPKLARALQDSLVAAVAPALITDAAGGAAHCMQTGDVLALQRMYKLTSLVKRRLKWTPPVDALAAPPAAAGNAGQPGSSAPTPQAPAAPVDALPVEMLRDVFKALALNDGRSLVSSVHAGSAKKMAPGQLTPMDFVNALIQLRESRSELISTAFSGDDLFRKALREAFQTFLNADARAALWLVLYLDDFFKAGARGKSDADIEQALEAALSLFRFLADKDLFENYYKQYLSRRLLAGRSVSDNAEQLFLTKLKRECGSHFTSKMEGMFRDLRASEDLARRYRADVAAGEAGAPGGHGLTLLPQVLTAGHWPPAVHPPCALPASVQPVLSAFEHYYLSKHGARTLTWVTEKGNAEVRFTATARAIDLIVTTYQMVILCTIGDAAGASLTFGQLQRATGIPAEELRRQTLSLATPHHRILLKSRKGKELQEHDTLTVNMEYTSRLLKVKVPLISLKSVLPTAANVVPRGLQEDRKHVIDAAIVRIMKTRQSLSHADMIAEVTHQLGARFRPSPPDIKKRIESLIERDYLERDDADARIYHYLA